eukprot:TRINITY_DN27668_c0_g1_i1.p1 TRINITY_DN27668_c0_g1~~TRINITY_DN27668_c0_g1_i1.p1  ORF type:complete len:915 (+),score=234.80 TRINITY_DN27668_c0_g1_i1:87-2831(+)
MRDADTDALPRYQRPPPRPTPPAARLMGHEPHRLRVAPEDVSCGVEYPNASMSLEVRHRRGSDSGRRSPRLVGSWLGEEVLRTALTGKTGQSPVFNAGGPSPARTPTPTRGAGTQSPAARSHRRTPSTFSGVNESSPSIHAGSERGTDTFVEFRGHRQAFVKAKRCRSQSSDVTQRKVREVQRRCGYRGGTLNSTFDSCQTSQSAAVDATPHPKDASLSLHLPSPQALPYPATAAADASAATAEALSRLYSNNSLTGANAEVDVDWIRACRKDPVHCRREFTEWLSRARFPVPHARHPNAVESELLNGTMLLRALVHCEAILLETDWSHLLAMCVDAPPRTLADCRAVYSHVYTIVARNLRTTPATFARVVDDVLSGDVDAAWCLCWVILKGYPPHIHSNIRHNVRPKSMFTGYAGDAMRKLDWCAANFLFALGLVRAVPKPAQPREPTDTYPASHYNMEAFKPAAAAPETITDDAVLPYLRNGTMLCELAEMLTKQPVVGVNPHPRVKKACLANIAAALAALRTVGGLSKVYINGSAEDEIYRGCLEVILALLEDIWRYIDKHPPRRHRVRPGDVPYLPDGFWGNRTPPPQYLRLAAGRAERSGEKYPVALSLASPRGSLTGSGTPRGSCALGTPRGRVHDPPVPRVAAVAEERSRSRPREVHVRASSRSRSQSASARRARAAAEKHVRRTTRRSASPGGGGRPPPKAPAGPALRDPPADPCEPPPPQRKDVGDAGQVAVLEGWLKGLVGRRVRLGGDVVPEFHDGTLLSTLFRKVERQHTDLPGIVPHPKRDAQKRFNIKKIVSLLNSRRSVIDLMKEPEDEVACGVFAADGAMLRRLLSQIRRCYHHTKLPAGGAHNINHSKMEVFMRVAEEMVPEDRAPAAEARRPPPPHPHAGLSTPRQKPLVREMGRP